METNLFKSYKCNFCGNTQYHITTPVLSPKRNIIACNCPECELGSMIINLDDETNFNDDFIDKYYNDLMTVLSEGGLNGNAEL